MTKKWTFIQALEVLSTYCLKEIDFFSALLENEEI